MCTDEDNTLILMSALLKYVKKLDQRFLDKE